MPPRTTVLAAALALSLSACFASFGSHGSAEAPPVTEAGVRAALSALSADSMEGRRTGTEGIRRARRHLAGRLREAGLQPAGDSGYVQRVPLLRDPERPARLTLAESWEAWSAAPEERRVVGGNVVAIVPGSDPELADEAILLTAHYDHLGIGRPVDGDSIYNGADDDASGVVAVVEAARAIAAGPAPRRTVVLFLATGEEMGMTGTRWYMDHPVVPLERTAGVLVVEMIGRPDSVAGGPGRVWLTGYERSTMGEILAAAGVPVVPDPRPEQNFFMRSDNTPFALRGVPAHALSSYGMHGEYHTPADEVERIDFAHMTEVVRTVVGAARALADGPRPAWNPGGRPEPAS